VTVNFAICIIFIVCYANHRA